MKKLFLLASLSLGLLMTQGVFADDMQQGQGNVTEVQSGPGQTDQGNVHVQYDDRYQPPHHDYYTNGQEFCCSQPTEQACGDCYCLYCKYEPCYYNKWRCEYEAKCCPKKCCRYVPKYYEKCCVRYVPQYYTQTCCRYCPEYYCVDETRYCKKWVCDRCCKYVPRYYYKHTCCPTPCNPCDPCQQ